MQRKYRDSSASLPLPCVQGQVGVRMTALPSLKQPFVLETERLLLRPLEQSDQEALLAIWGDAENMRFYPHPFSREEVGAWIERNRARYREYRGGLFGLLDKKSGELVGACGPSWQEVEGKQELEVGYHVRRDRWGQGLATEAAKACMQYGFNELGPVCRIISMIRPENLPSRRVAEKNGLACEKVVLWREYQHSIYQVRKAPDSGATI